MEAIFQHLLVQRTEREFFLCYIGKRNYTINHRPSTVIQHHSEMFVYPLDSLLQPVLCFGINFLTIFTYIFLFFSFPLYYYGIILPLYSLYTFIECEDVCVECYDSQCITKHKSNMTTDNCLQDQRLTFETFFF